MSDELTLEINLSEVKETKEKAEDARLQIALTALGTINFQNRKSVLIALKNILECINGSKEGYVYCDEGLVRFSMSKLESIFYGSKVILNILFKAVGIKENNAALSLEKPTDIVLARINDIDNFLDTKAAIDEHRKTVKENANMYIKMPLKVYQEMEYRKDGDKITEGIVQQLPNGRFIFVTYEGIEWFNNSLFKQFANGARVKVLKKGTGVEVKECK
ncbi:hypothetical protein JW911_00060 [Candidatus Peregrinibacteria bacterium]|nr:hypothetical protein [Candidatus Peregrinibacteria bacterium]